METTVEYPRFRQLTLPFNHFSPRMHRPLKRPRDDAGRAWVSAMASKRQRTDRERLEDVAEEDMLFFSERRRAMQDSADRPIATRVTTDRTPLVKYGVVPYNRSRRLDTWRLTGDRLYGRTLRSEHTPLNDALFFQPSSYDPVRGLYRCVNCGKYTTAAGLRNWFNPGYNTTDVLLTVGGGSDPFWNQPFEEEYDDDGNLILPEHLRLDRLLPQPSFGSSDNMPRMIEVMADQRTNARRVMGFNTHLLPVVIACSRRCAEEQAVYNLARNARHIDTLNVDSRLSQGNQYQRGDPDVFDALWQEVPSAARISEEDAASLGL